jgi:hypothetical protein
MSSSSEVRLGIRREVRLLGNFATVFSNDNAENSTRREFMPGPQLPASVTGTIISHDGWSMDRIATQILAFEGNSHVEWFEGNYEDYEKDRKKRMGADADTPHRIKYRRIDA